MNALRCLVALLIAVMAGCVAPPPQPVEMTASLGREAAMPGKRARPPEPGNGHLSLQIRWPQADRPSFRAASIPTTTRTLAVFVYKDGELWAGPERFSRQAEPGEPYQARLLMREADNLSVEVRAYRDADPPDLDQGEIARGVIAGINIRAARTTQAVISLDALFVPTVDGFDTNVAPVGDTITIFGTNLGTIEGVAPRVYFGGLEAANVEPINDTELEVKVPQGAESGFVVVEHDGITSAGGEDAFWVLTDLAIDGTRTYWDPSGGDDRKLLLFDYIFLYPVMTFAGSDLGRLGYPPYQSGYVTSNPAAGTIDAGYGAFLAGGGVATTDIRARVGSMLSDNFLAVSVEEVTALALDRDFALVPPGTKLGLIGAPPDYYGQTYSRSITAVATLSGGATASVAAFDSSEPARLEIRGDYAQGQALGFVTLSAYSPLDASILATASVAVASTGGAALVSTFSGSGGEFTVPIAMALDPQGRVHVADFAGGVSGRRQVLRLDAGGTIAAVFDLNARAIAFDRAGDLFGADAMSGRVVKLSDLDGSPVETVFAADLDRPTAIAVDGADNVYVGGVSNSLGPRILKYASDGTLLAEYSGLELMTGIAAEPDGTLFIAQTLGTRCRVDQLEPDGTLTTLAGGGPCGHEDGSGPDARFFLGVVGLATDGEGTVYVAEGGPPVAPAVGNNRIRAISASGEVMTLAGSGVAGYADGEGLQAEFHGPTGIAVAANGDLYVSELGNRLIRKLASGTAQAVVGRYPADLLVEVE